MANTHKYVGDAITTEMKKQKISYRKVEAKTEKVYSYKINSISKGGECTLTTLFKVLDALGLEITINEKDSK